MLSFYLLITTAIEHHHGKSNEYYKFIHNQPDDSLKDRFLEQYAKIMNIQNGYFSVDGVPYYSVETLAIDGFGGVDYGHETTSKVYSSYIWLTAMNIWATGSITDFEAAWTSLEKYIIPSGEDQPTCSSYDPSAPSSFAQQGYSLSDYPVLIDRNVKVGQDILNDELAQVYGSGNKLTQIYLPHKVLDIDNIYRFDDDVSDRNVLISLFKRGPAESIWQTLPCSTTIKDEEVI